MKVPEIAMEMAVDGEMVKMQCSIGRRAEKKYVERHMNQSHDQLITVNNTLLNIT